MGQWRDAGSADLTAGELRGLTVGQKQVLLADDRGQLCALDDLCNHAGCLLSGGYLDLRKHAVVCPCHEYAFELRTGRNVTFPRLCDDQRAFPVKAEGGRILVQVDDMGEV